MNNTGLNQIKGKKITRTRLEVEGIVQGVGFRPFVFNLATRHQLTGFVLNNSYGLIIEVQGEAHRIDSFKKELQENPPVLAQITKISLHEIPVQQSSSFQIKKSERQSGQFTLISPDISVCDDCLRELFDPSDRRFRYPFINCTNCGPRFTIIKDIPYDRPKTTMAGFQMCEACEAEYENPADRRFHAQPNACPVCGPQVWLADSQGSTIEGDPAQLAVQFLEEGKIVAVKGLGGFHLAVDATNTAAVEALRERKRRYEKPLALMSKDVESIEKFAFIHEKEIQILESPQRPICLLVKRKPSPISDSVSPDNDYLGVMLAYTPLHYLLMHVGDFPALVMTSGNLSEEPIAYGNEGALRRLGEIADYFLLHNRDIYQRADDSVVRFMNEKVSFIRRSRGFVPRPMMVTREMPSVLAVGGELKNTVCLNKKKFYFLSQHIGDLENTETLDFFEESIRHLRGILEIEPQLIGYDLHPEYLSTRWALQQREHPVTGIQHHHAHIAACMAEKSLTGDVIGFSLDGTGYGTDGTIWGGEVLLANELDFKRLAHFRTILMPGGEKAIKEPWRMALSYCRECGIDLPVSKYFPQICNAETDLVRQMLDRKINSPVTSSCGRLFDAVAALCGLRSKVGYEGQAAMQLEALIKPGKFEGDSYEVKIDRVGEVYILDWEPIFRELLNDLKNSMEISKISWKFHAGLVNGYIRLAKILREEYRANRIALSGGCFQNRFLSEYFTEKLLENEFEVFYQTIVPPNDGGLSLGQAYIASHRLKQGYEIHEIS